MTGFSQQREDNPMWKHVWETHGGKGEVGIFKMKMERGFKKPLARQIREGVEIETSRNNLMNSKAEWNNSCIPRIIIEEGEQQTEDDSSGLNKKGGNRKGEMEGRRQNKVNIERQRQIGGKRHLEDRET